MAAGLEGRVFDKTSSSWNQRFLEASALLQLLLIRVGFVVVWYFSGRSVKTLNSDYPGSGVMLGRSRIPITG